MFSLMGGFLQVWLKPPFGCNVAVASQELASVTGVFLFIADGACFGHGLEWFS